MHDYSYRAERNNMRSNKSNSRRLININLHGLSWFRGKGHKGIMLTSVLYGLLLFSLLIASITDNEKTAIISGVFALLNSFILWKLQHGIRRMGNRVDRVEREVTEDD